MTTTNSNSSLTADQIANSHGCDITPGANGRVAITVQARWQQGELHDDARIRTCREALRSAGIRLHEVATSPIPPIERGLPIAPGLPIGGRGR